MGSVAQIAPSFSGATSMSYFDAVSAGFRNYFDFEGRATRPEYWWFYLFVLLVSLGAAVADMSFGLGSEDMGGPISVIAWLGTIIPMLSVGARRLHDIGRSGWWQLIALTGIGIIVLIYWWCQPSQPG
jgi:uncharacterized membrane protein YhaH (DUF805 family)